MSTAPEPQVWPTLRARDAQALIRFLTEAFGFEETVVYADGNVVHHAQLSWPEGGGIMLGSVRPGSASQGGASATDPGAFGAYVVTSQPDALCERAGADRRRDHRGTARYRLRLPGLLRPGPGGEPLVVRHLPRRAPQGLTRRPRGNVPRMRAWHVEAPGPVTGHPLRLSTTDDVPEPGPGELLLKVLACGVCRTDLHVTEGDLPPHRPGVTPGHEVVGEVVALGATPGEPGVTRSASRSATGPARPGFAGRTTPASSACAARRTCARTPGTPAGTPTAATPST